jgi:AcrR family transcriptional regulator
LVGALAVPLDNSGGIRYFITDTTVGNNSMPKVVDLDQKKAEIAHKALYAFAFEGYHKTSLGAIARMCHIGRTTIYEYFKDKDEIFSYTLNHSFDLLQPDLQQILLAKGRTSLERVAAILRAILGLFYQDKRVLLVLVEHSLRILRENREVAGRLRDRVRGLQDLLEGLLQEGIRTGEVRTLDPHGQAQILTMLLEAAILHFSMNPSASLEQVTAGLETLIQGLKA